MTERPTERELALEHGLSELTRNPDDTYTPQWLIILVQKYYAGLVDETFETPNLGTRFETFKDSDDPAGEVLADFMYWLLGNADTPGFNAR